MNTIVTSRERLLAAAKKIAGSEGLSKLSIRHLASACGVSVGSIYYYFPTKADLVVAVVEDFWRESFHGTTWPEPPDGRFTAFLGELYGRFRRYLDSFQSDWLAQLSCLPPSERQKGKELEAFYFGHIRRGLALALERDRTVSPELWSADFTPEKLTALAFDSMLASLRRGEGDCAFLCEILERLLYRQEHLSSGRTDTGVNFTDENERRS